MDTKDDVTLEIKSLQQYALLRHNLHNEVITLTLILKNILSRFFLENVNLNINIET